MYITKDRNLTEGLIKEAEKNGFQALVITVDAPQLGKRENNVRNKFSLPPHLRLKVLESQGNKMQMIGEKGDGLFELFMKQIDESITWKDI